jgi:hypothetical protein
MQDIDSTYGSDQHRLIWGYHFVPSHPASPITSKVAAEFLAAPELDEFLWLQFSLANVVCEPWLRQHRAYRMPFMSGCKRDRLRLAEANE